MNIDNHDGGALSTPPRGAGGPRPRQGPRTRPRSGTGCPAPPRKLSIYI